MAVINPTTTGTTELFLGYLDANAFSNTALNARLNRGLRFIVKICVLTR